MITLAAAAGNIKITNALLLNSPLAVKGPNTIPDLTGAKQNVTGSIFGYWSPDDWAVPLINQRPKVVINNSFLNTLAGMPPLKYINSLRAQAPLRLIPFVIGRNVPIEAPNNLITQTQIAGGHGDSLDFQNGYSTYAAPLNNNPGIGLNAQFIQQLSTAIGGIPGARLLNSN
jgi:hypothetical protein